MCTVLTGEAAVSCILILYIRIQYIHANFTLISLNEGKNMTLHYRNIFNAVSYIVFCSLVRTLMKHAAVLYLRTLRKEETECTCKQILSI